MAEAKNGDELPLPTKRCPDLTIQDSPNGPKKQKLEDINNGKQASEPLEPVIENDVVRKEVEAVEEEREKEQQQQEQEVVEEEDEENPNDKAVTDRKGKGILIEEDEEDDDDDSDSGSDSNSDSGIGDNLSDDSDFADDPLAEVDLDNILPCRTRRRAIQPGAYIAIDLPDDDSDESDDPDA